MTVQLNPHGRALVSLLVWAKESSAAGLKVEVGCGNNGLKYNEQ